MNISLKIDQLVQNLTELKISLSEDPEKNASQFNEILFNATENLKDSNYYPLNNKYAETGKAPDWVDIDYGFDISAPRKPNMRELMEALSGEAVEDLSTRSKAEYAEYSSLASQLLYEVIGDGPDTRDWQNIMSSEDILATSREKTGEMLKPTIDVQSEFDLETGVLVRQYPVIKNELGETLRKLHGSSSKIESTLKNYGIKEPVITPEVFNKVDPNIVDKDILPFLESLSKAEMVTNKNQNSIETSLLQSTSAAISNKIITDINDSSLL